MAIGVLAVGGVLVDAAPVRASTVAVDDPAALTAATAADEARKHVLKIAKSGLPAEIRTSAWNALRSTRGDAAIADWLAPGGGHDVARKRLSDTRSRNREFCERVVRTHPVGFSPEVRSAAERALRGSDADRAAFVKTGYATAQQRDRTGRSAETEHRLLIADRHRAFVRGIAMGDPGEQVRVAAQWALRAGSTDEDVAEFFGYGWASGAALDIEAFRLRVTGAEVRRRHELSMLIARVATAEAALRSSPGAAQLRAEAEGAWQAVADHADGARKAWIAEQATATAQAEAWRSTGRVSNESADEVWKHVSAPAEARSRDWSTEQVEAGETAGFWKVMADGARDNKNRVTG
ncbi:ALF repeat-containing protein [Streptomyces sp. NPDC101118]|uniref:ALF repeat-containing protein n=1 Tax=Streptomyces sp. NPDC101118 TaxID=3366109 RepID=UPI0038035360